MGRSAKYDFDSEFAEGEPAVIDPQDSALISRVFRYRLHKRMLALGIASQAELARRSQVRKDTIWTYFNRGSLPDTENLMKLASALGCTTADLLPTTALQPSAHHPVEMTPIPGAAGMYSLRINIPLPLSVATDVLTLLQKSGLGAAAA